MKTIIILGGGVGGIVTANELCNRLSGEHKIILIEKNKEHTFAPSYLWLMNGDRRKKQIKVPLKMVVKSGWFKKSILQKSASIGGKVTRHPG